MHHTKRLLAIVLVLAGCKADKKETTPVADSGPTRDASPEAGPPVVKGPVSFGDEPVLGASCNGKVVAGKSGPLPTFKRTDISKQPGAAFMKAADLNADGFPEILLTTLAEGLDFSVGIPPVSAGGGYVLSRDGGKPDGTLGTWTSTMVFDRDTKVKEGDTELPIAWPNSSELVDIDNDGIKDWSIGAGFLTKPRGLIVWMKGSESGKFAKPRAITVPDPTCWYHITLPVDMDADGDEDFVTSCHIGMTGNTNLGSRLEWAENPGDDSGKFTFRSIGDGGGALISLHDMDDDGDQDVVAPQFWGPESFVWFEQTGKGGSAWAKHVINNTTGRGFMNRFADMNGDGKVDLLYGNHNNELATDPVNQTMGIYWFDIPPADKIAKLDNWDDYIHTVHEGFMVFGEDNGNSGGAPGIINVGDVDGDCDMDVTASGDGDPGLYVFIQQADKFEKVDLDVSPDNVNSGEHYILDLDGDGDQDMIWGVFGPIPSVMTPAFNSYVAAFLQD